MCSRFANKRLARPTECAYNERMTITCPSSPASRAPLILRILAAHRLTVSARVRCWSSIGWLLTSCAVGDDGFARSGRQASEIWDTSREEIYAAEGGHGRRRVPRVIEATCVEVA